MNTAKLHFIHLLHSPSLNGKVGLLPNPLPQGENMNQNTNRTGLVVALADRLWVLVLPNGELYDDGEGEPGDPMPATWRRKADAEHEAAQLAVLAADIGVKGWRARVIRLGDAVAGGTTSHHPLDLPREPYLPPHLPTDFDLDETVPAPADRVRTEWVIALPSNGPWPGRRALYADNESVVDGHRYTAYPSLEEAREAAREITHDLAVRLGIEGHQVRIFTRTTTTSTGPWNEAEGA